MERLKMHSSDISQERIAMLRDLFPSCVTEATDASTGAVRLAVDIDQLQQELHGQIVSGDAERYRLDWPGKRKAIAGANEPIEKTLRPVLEESVDFEATKNLFIEGDNLEVLKLIQESYLGKIKLIYIDPPYNTGNQKNFIYRDSFRLDKETQARDAQEMKENGIRLVANLEGNGRFHSRWLTMIAPRLRLARSLLRRDGAIFVSCDEVEQPRLRLLMDEIFGQSNFVADIVWEGGRKNNSRLISVSHEYIVCYVRDGQYLKDNDVRWRERKSGLDEIYSQYRRLQKKHGGDIEKVRDGLQKWYSKLDENDPSKEHSRYKHVDQRGIYFPDNISSPGGDGPKYEVLHPKTKMPVKVPQPGWRITSPQKMMELIADDRIHFGVDESKVPCIKKYLFDVEYQVPTSVFYRDGRGASARLTDLMDGKAFDFPKDEQILQRIVEMTTEGDDLILDFFAGSSTTAHAVMLQNEADGENRKFIMVQLDEEINGSSKATELGYNTIAEISRERIRRAGVQVLKGRKETSSWNGDIGFRALKVDSSNMKDIYYYPNEIDQAELSGMVDNVKQGRTHDDLLFQVLLDWGLDLSVPIRSEKVRRKQVFFVEENTLIACFEKRVDEDLIKELAIHQPMRFVFRDCGPSADALQINVAQIFRQVSPKTEIKAL